MKKAEWKAESKFRKCGNSLLISSFSTSSLGIPQSCEFTASLFYWESGSLFEFFGERQIHTVSWNGPANLFLGDRKASQWQLLPKPRRQRAKGFLWKDFKELQTWYWSSNSTVSATSLVFTVHYNWSKQTCACWLRCRLLTPERIPNRLPWATK